MKVIASTPEEYINQLPGERQTAITQLRQTILDNIPSGFEETMSYGMIGYVVPKSVYPPGYHCNTQFPLPFINIGSQKNFVAFYHLGLYADPDLLEWFRNEYSKHSKYKLDMGKSCIRFKKMEQIPYGLIAQLVCKMSVEQWIQFYEKEIKKVDSR
jgi:uncharacterized protein YdhG (YjbR/CyaY superfamily)